MTEIQQSRLYAAYLTRLGWQTPKLDGSYVFIKNFPIIGGFAKIQRVKKLPTLGVLLPFLARYNVGRIVVEPDASVKQIQFAHWCTRLSKHMKLLRSPYLATKTRVIDLRTSEKYIFRSFSEAKRRAVRRAIKCKVIIQESHDIDAFIKLKNTSAGFLGFITTTGIKPLWNIFSPNHATILTDKKYAAGVLLLFWNKTAYYWLAGSTKSGKKLFTPTLLVWEALKLSKKKGCKRFDFVGIWDERMPKTNLGWIGFTKFKEGFGGQSLYYPLNTEQNA